MKTVAVIFVLCVSILLNILLAHRLADVEHAQQLLGSSVGEALGKFLLTLETIERRQTSLETSFSTSEQTWLTMQQLRSYNEGKKPPPWPPKVKTSVGGGRK